MKIPFVDVASELVPLKAEIFRQLEATFERGDFIQGGAVEAFEREFASFCGVQHGIGVANGTDAIHLALRAAGIGAGDGVLVPAHTFFASASAIALAGATPVPVEVDDSTFLIDLEKAEETLARAKAGKAAAGLNIKAIIGVHLYGRLIPPAALKEFAEKHGLMLIEDAAQAHGAEIQGHRAGSIGKLASFSFYPSKNLGAAGDAGIVVTDDDALAARLQALRNHGQPKKNSHAMLGLNSRLDTVQAIVLKAKLANLEDGNRSRIRSAIRYNDQLAGVGDLVLPEIPAEATAHVFHLYVVRTKKRDELMKHLDQRGIGVGIHYPTPIHLHGAFKHLGYKAGDFPVAEKICGEILSLPMFPGMTDDQRNAVVTAVKEFF